MKLPNIFLYSLVLAFCIFVQISHADQFPQSVLKEMATRQMRHHHFMWHQIRGNWNRFSNETKAAFKKIGWEPPNPARDEHGKPMIFNYAGQDFLYMHRQMILQAKEIAAKNNESLTPFVGWKSIPAPGDKRYPVPPAFKKGKSNNFYGMFKSDAHYEYMRKMEQELKDPEKLKKLTLNQLGLKIENRIHNSLHFRWTGASPIGYRSGDVLNASMPHIDKKWDDIRYDWMGDSYGSHVNPLIWKVHGWIDDRVEDWRKAKGYETINWRGTWVGGPMTTLGGAFQKTGGEHMHMHDNSTAPDAVGDILAQAAEIFHKSGVPELTMEDDHKLANQHRKPTERNEKKSEQKKQTKKAGITTAKGN